MTSSKLSFALSGFVDEVFDTLDDQINFANQMGMKFICLRFFKLSSDSKKMNVFDLSEAQAREVRKKLDDAGLVADVAGLPIGKLDNTIDDGIFETVNFSVVLEKAKRFAPISEILGVSFARVFGGNLSDTVEFSEVSKQVVEQIAQVVEVFSQVGVFTAVENEGFTACPTAEAVAHVCEKVGSDYCGAIFDEANQIAIGDDYDYALTALKVVAPYLVSVHAKCLDPKDPALKQGQQTHEDQLTKFTRPQGPVFEYLFRIMAETVIPNFTARCERVGNENCEFSVALEPHRAKSGRFEGKTEKPDFADSALAILNLSAANDLVCDFDDKNLHILRNPA